MLENETSKIVSFGKVQEFSKGPVADTYLKAKFKCIGADVLDEKRATCLGDGKLLRKHRFRADLKVSFLLKVERPATSSNNSVQW